jgi:hypothetical protein
MIALCFLLIGLRLLATATTAQHQKVQATVLVQTFRRAHPELSALEIAIDTAGGCRTVAATDPKDVGRLATTMSCARCVSAWIFPAARAGRWWWRKRRQRAGPIGLEAVTTGPLSRTSQSYRTLITEFAWIFSPWKTRVPEV